MSKQSASLTWLADTSEAGKLTMTASETVNYPINLITFISQPALVVCNQKDHYSLGLDWKIFAERHLVFFQKKIFFFFEIKIKLEANRFNKFKKQATQTLTILFHSKSPSPSVIHIQ